MPVPQHGDIGVPSVKSDAMSIDPALSARLEEAAARYGALERLAADPAQARDQRAYRELMQEYAQLAALMRERGRLQSLTVQIEEAEELAAAEEDRAMRELADEEVGQLRRTLAESAARAVELLTPPDPDAARNIIMEIRAGTGGDEAALFTADLYRMYSRYAEGKRWKVELISSSQTEIGGFRELSFSVAGADVFDHLRWESGVHRVQRVPVTESQGRIHTSAVTVAVLPEVQETEVELRPEEVRVDVYRSSGPGGQSVNTTDSAVRLTHLPTGLVVTCQDEKSQHKNRAKAQRVLRARLYEAEQAKRAAERAEHRRSQIGSGDRSERIRTYNVPQNRVTDHRINLTLYRLEAVLLGELEEVIAALRDHARQAALRTVLA